MTFPFGLFWDGLLCLFSPPFSHATVLANNPGLSGFGEVLDVRCILKDEWGDT